jgi:hypothetical protein
VATGDSENGGPYLSASHRLAGPGGRTGCRQDTHPTHRHHRSPAKPLHHIQLAPAHASVHPGIDKTDYRYTGNLNKALPIPSVLEPLLTWAQDILEPRLNGMLINWYDGSKGHYIGPHRDSPAGLLKDAPIITISFGVERIFRVRPYGGKGKIDILMVDGTVIVIPCVTNRTWTHEVPKRAKGNGKRMSVTLRAFG